MSSFREALEEAAKAWPAGTSGPTLRAVVEEHLGTGNRGVVRAVGAFFAGTTSNLDLAGLELVAAAAPFMSPEHLARLIEQLPRTRLPVGMAPVDIAMARSQLAAVLGSASEPAYPSAVTARLVGSLVRASTVRTLELVPAGRLTPVARELVRAKLEDDLRHGSLDVVDAAVLSLAADVWQREPELWCSAAERVLRIRPDHDDREAMLSHLVLAMPPGAPTDVLSQLAATDAEAAVRVARHPNAAPAFLEEVARHGTSEQRVAVAENVGAPLALLAASAVDPDAGVRRALAGNEAAGHGLLREVWQAAKRAGHRDVLVLGALARNPATPTDVQADLATHADSAVRRMLALNDALDRSVLMALSFDRDPDVRYWVAGRRGLPSSALQRLVEDPDPRVRSRLGKQEHMTPALLRRLLAKGTVEDRRAVAVSAVASVEQLAQLAADPDGWVRQEVAKNHRSSEPILRRLAVDADEHVRRLILQNPATPRGLLEELLAGGAADQMDPHDRHVLATDATRTALPVLQHGAVARLEESVESVRLGLALPPAAGLRDWDQLPSLRDLPFQLPIDPQLVEELDLAGFRGHVARTPRDLDRLHRRMGNCLDGYADRARRGEVVVGWLEDPERHEVYAAAWVRGSAGRYRLQEVNSKGNRDKVPVDLRSAVRDLGPLLHLTFESARARWEMATALPYRTASRAGRARRAAVEAKPAAVDGARGDMGPVGTQRAAGEEGLRPGGAGRPPGAPGRGGAQRLQGFGGW